MGLPSRNCCATHLQCQLLPKLAFKCKMALCRRFSIVELGRWCLWRTTE
uniref:Uncharacterized protein n=1 Tax=Arundo donax TaxID=35708 RepID=A0A0A8YPH4_ARUDO